MYPCFLMVRLILISQELCQNLMNGGMNDRYDKQQEGSGKWELQKDQSITFISFLGTSTSTTAQTQTCSSGPSAPLPLFSSFLSSSHGLVPCPPSGCSHSCIQPAVWQSINVSACFTWADFVTCQSGLIVGVVLLCFSLLLITLRVLGYLSVSWNFTKYLV